MILASYLESSVMIQIAAGQRKGYKRGLVVD
jgi:hypothetical protein